MSLIRRMFPEVRQMARHMDDVFWPTFSSRLWRRDPFEEAGGFVPTADIQETADKFVIETELPGISKEQVKMELADEHTIVVRGELERKIGASGENRPTMWSRERIYGNFMRSFTLPTKIREDKVEAELKDGILRIEVPKQEETQKQLNVVWKD